MGDLQPCTKCISESILKLQSIQSCGSPLDRNRLSYLVRCEAGRLSCLSERRLLIRPCKTQSQLPSFHELQFFVLTSWHNLRLSLRNQQASQARPRHKTRQQGSYTSFQEAAEVFSFWALGE